MSDREVLVSVLKGGLSASNAHLSPDRGLEALSAELAGQRPAGSPHTIWQLLSHLTFWQLRFMDYLEGHTLPRVASAVHGWIDEDGPRDQEHLDLEIRSFLEGLMRAEELIASPETLTCPEHYDSPQSVVQAMGSHMSYHLGEIVLLRRILGDYPPPSGGDTW